jgi:hypothetical protein
LIVEGRARGSRHRIPVITGEAKILEPDEKNAGARRNIGPVIASSAIHQAIDRSANPETRSGRLQPGVPRRVPSEPDFLPLGASQPAFARTGSLPGRRAAGRNVCASCDPRKTLSGLTNNWQVEEQGTTEERARSPFVEVWSTGQTKEISGDSNALGLRQACKRPPPRCAWHSPDDGPVARDASGRSCSALCLPHSRKLGCGALKTNHRLHPTAATKSLGRASRASFSGKYRRHVLIKDSANDYLTAGPREGHCCLIERETSAWRRKMLETDLRAG